MQNFKQKQIALAVAGGLMVMAGAAQATAPALRAANPMLTASVNGGVAQADIRALLSATGAVNKAITIDVALTQAPVAIPAAGTSWTAAIAGADSTATVASTAGLVVGMTITSAQALFPADAVITGVTNATTFTFSSATTAVPVSAAGANAATATPPAGPLAGGVAQTVVGSVNSAAALVMGNATPANNSVIVWAGATNANTVPSTGATAVIGATAAGVAHMTISLPAPGATAAYRVNGATGALEYSATGATWDAVKVDIQQVAGKEIYTEVDGVAGYVPANDQGAAASAGTAAGNSLAPTPVISTTSAAGGDLVNGFKIDTGATITLTNANLAVATRATAQAFPAAALPAAPACVAATATVNGSCTVTFVGLGTLASAADFAAPAGVDATDVAFYNSTNFNTGVVNGTVPWTVDGVNASKASYTNVFNTSDGLASKLANFGGSAAGDAAAFPATTVVSDGATPVIVTAANSGGNALQLTFSEPMYAMYGGGANINSAPDKREVMENVFLSGSFTSNGAAATSASLAAIALNNGLNLGGTIATTAGQSTLTITGLSGGVLTPTSTVTVKTGITFKEPNDSGYSATVPALDNLNIEEKSNDTGGYVYLGGGLASSSGAVEAASVTAKAITPAVVTVDYDEATAYAQTIASDPAKVGQIIVTFPAGKEISLASGLTTADLVGQIRVTVFNGNNSSQSYQFFPTATQMAINTAGTQMTISLPTDQIYANIDSVYKMDVEYLGLVAGNGALVKKASSAIAVASLTANDRVADGDVTVKLPLSAQYGGNAGLVTQSIIGSFTGVTNGDRVAAFLAHWDNAPVANSQVLATLTGTVSAPAGNSLAFGAGEEATLRTAIQSQLNAVAPAKPAVPGVSNAVSAVTTKPISLYFVVSDGVATLYDDATSAGAASTTIINAILSAAEDAGWDGSAATGADGSMFANSGNTTATTSTAALAAGSASAAAAVFATAAVPQAVKIAAANAAAVSNATPGSVMKAVVGLINDYKVKTASVDPSNGKITGGVTGSLTIKNNTTTTARRGLIIDSSYNADAVVGTVNGQPNSFNLLVGVNPATADLKAAVKPDEFVILVHESAATGTRTMITSADPTAKNYLPFSANLLTGSGTRTTLAPIDLSLILVKSEGQTGSWELIALGNEAKQTAPAGHPVSFERGFVGLDNWGYPVSTWTSEGYPGSPSAGAGYGGDIALAMVGSKSFAATETGNNMATLSTITSSNYVTGAAALAWKNDNTYGPRAKLYKLQAGPVAGKAPVGWSLVTVPASGTFGTAVDAVIKVGAQTSAPYTWIKGDTGTPALTAGEAVFVYSKVGGNL